MEASGGFGGARRPQRGPARDRQRGASIIEFALIAPILFAILFGVIDYGLVLKDDIGVEQGVREAARQGTVASFGSRTSCSNGTLPSGTKTEMKKLVCLTKARSSVPDADIRVAIRFDPVGGGSAASAYPAGTGSPPVGNGLVICAITPMESTTGFFSTLMDGRYVRSKVNMRIEKAAGTAQTPTQETDPSGEAWSWCTP